MPDDSPPAKRLPGLDALKGLAIAGVILIHAAPSDAPAYVAHAVNGTARLAVPLFLVVTGFLAGWRNTPRERFAAYFRKFLGLHIAYGFWYWAVSSVATGSAGDLSPKGLLLHFGEAAFPGQFYLGFLLPVRFWTHGASAIGAAVLALATLPLPQVAPELFPGDGLGWVARRVLGSGSMLWLWLHYVTLGAWLGARARRGASVPFGTLAWGFAALGLAIATSTLPTAPWEDAFIDPYARWSIWLGASAVALAVPALAGWPAPRLRHCS